MIEGVTLNVQGNLSLPGGHITHFAVRVLPQPFEFSGPAFDPPHPRRLLLLFCFLPTQTTGALHVLSPAADVVVEDVR